MKKSILALASLAFLGVQAQQVDYNRWSVDVNGGVNKATTPFTAGYGTSTPNFWSANVGVRYMANNKFGIRLAGGYDVFKNDDEQFPFFCIICYVPSRSC